MVQTVGYHSGLSAWPRIRVPLRRGRGTRWHQTLSAELAVRGFDEVVIGLLRPTEVAHDTKLVSPQIQIADTTAVP